MSRDLRISGGNGQISEVSAEVLLGTAFAEGPANPGGRHAPESASGRPPGALICSRWQTGRRTASHGDHLAQTSSTIERCSDMSRRPVQSKGSPESDVPRHAITMSWNTAPVGHGGVVAMPSSGVRNRPSCRPCRDSASGPRSAVRHPGTLPARVDRGHRRPALHGIGHSRTDMAACAHSASHMAAGARHRGFPSGDHDHPVPRRQPGRSASRQAATACRHQRGLGSRASRRSRGPAAGRGGLARGLGRATPAPIGIRAGDTRPNRHPGGRHPPRSADTAAPKADEGRCVKMRRCHSRIAS